MVPNDDEIVLAVRCFKDNKLVNQVKYLYISLKNSRRNQATTINNLSIAKKPYQSGRGRQKIRRS